MLPNYEDVKNLKLLILLSQDHRTAQQLLLDMLSSCTTELQQGLYHPQLVTKILTIIQAYCEFNLTWQQQFNTCLDLIHDENLYSQFITRLSHKPMQCRPTKQALAYLIHWQPCHRNLLIPTKQEVVQVVHYLCKRTPITHHIYYFDDGRHNYQLYWQNGCWYWRNVHKQLIWIIR